MGFLAARWRKAETEHSLDEWGLGGRSFGTWVTWFLLGGDLYTAYTFVAVPAAIYAAGAAGFFAVPYTILVYPLIFTFLPRLWSVSHKHGYVTTSDFVRGRFGSKGLSLAVAVTGILATMPYIALQLVGIQAVLDVMGVGGGPGHQLVRQGPAAADRVRGARRVHVLVGSARARADRVREGRADLSRHRRRDHLHPDQARRLRRRSSRRGDAFSADQRRRRASRAARSRRARPAQWTYATLALGSALALFMYPHSITATLSSKSRNVIRRNTTILPLYSLMLGLLALLGFMAIAAGVKVDNGQLAIPQLFENMFPDWFTGVAFAAIGIGALVPAAIMSIAAANLFTRNIYKDFLKPDATPAAGDQGLQAGLAPGEGRRARLRPHHGQDGRDQLPAPGRHLDPADLAGAGRRPVHPVVPPLGAARRLGGRHDLRHARRVRRRLARRRSTSAARPTEIPGIGEIGYIGLTAFVLNVVVTVVLTFVLKALKAPEGVDETSPEDYTADAGDPGVVEELPPATAGAGH